MNLHELKRSEGSTHRRKRVGRGRGSGVGKTSGRGQKGQMSRSGSGRKLGFEGGQMPLIRRIPKRGFNHASAPVIRPVNVGDLNRFEEGRVDVEALRASGLVNGNCDGVKILGEGDLDRKLTVEAHAFSKSAREKIEAAGGQCETIQ